MLQQCRVGISTTGGHDFGPFYHLYHCWINGRGERVCRGYSFNPASNPGLLDKITGPVDGTVLKDQENWEDGKKETCDADDGDSCMNSCAAGAWNSVATSPPIYGLLIGSTCQTVTSNIQDFCRKMCSSIRGN